MRFSNFVDGREVLVDGDVLRQRSMTAAVQRLGRYETTSVRCVSRFRPDGGRRVLVWVALASPFVDADPIAVQATAVVPVDDETAKLVFVLGSWSAVATLAIEEVPERLICGYRRMVGLVVGATLESVE